jgi:hypothetical protein
MGIAGQTRAGKNHGADCDREGIFGKEVVAKEEGNCKSSEKWDSTKY